MLKKVSSILILVIILFTVISSVYAIETFPGVTRDPGGFSLNAKTKSENNRIYACGEITSVPSGYTVKVTAVLQKKTTNGGWTKAASKTGGQEVSAWCKYSKGTYRAKVLCTVTENATQKTKNLTPVYSRETEYK